MRISPEVYSQITCYYSCVLNLKYIFADKISEYGPEIVGGFCLYLSSELVLIEVRDWFS